MSKLKRAEQEFTLCAVALGLATGVTGALVALGYGLRSETIMGVAQLFAGLSTILGLGLVYWGWRLWRGM